MTRDDLEAMAGGNKAVAALRYLAFLSMERRFLLDELFPGRKWGDTYLEPCNTQVQSTVLAEPPLARAERVLRALGIDPFAADVWTDTIWRIPPPGAR